MKSKQLLAVFWGVSAVAVMGMLAVIMQPGQNILMDYQKARIVAYLNGDKVNYMQMEAMRWLKDSDLFGESNVMNTSAAWADYDAVTMSSDFAISVLSARCGRAAVAATVVLLAALIVSIFTIARRQSNELGAVIGCSVGMVFGIQTFVYLLNNLGWIPYMSGYLPLISYGGSGAVVSYILLGLALSVYRFQDIPAVEGKRTRDSRIPT